jgi:hypothetical protein
MLFLGVDRKLKKNVGGLTSIIDEDLIHKKIGLTETSGIETVIYIYFFFEFFF